MKALLAALLLAATSHAAAQAPSTTPQQVDALVALARVHGVVRYFHPSDAVEGMKAWDKFLVHATERMQSASPAEVGPRLTELYSPLVDGFRVAAPGMPVVPPGGEGPMIDWRHLGYGVDSDASSPYASWRTKHAPLGHGKVKGSFFQHRTEADVPVHADPVMRVALPASLEAHVPVSLPTSAVQVGEAQRARLDALDAILAKVALADDDVTRAQAHADGIAAWNVARHFYPYWADVKVDWEGNLRQWLPRQPATQTRAQLRDQIRRLVEPLVDAQAEVIDTRKPPNRAFLAISVRAVGNAWVVDASRVSEIRAGDVVVGIAGQPTAKWFAERMALFSGSPQHKRWRARLELLAGEKDSKVGMRLQRGKDTIDAAFIYNQPQPAQPLRPPAIFEMRPGVHYVDASRFDKAAFEKALETMKDAKGVVFDLRGFPANDAMALASYWIARPDSAQWMFVPRFDRPDATSSTAWSIGWNVGANATLAKAKKVLLVDGRAIGYAESLAQYFPAHGTGPVVGEATAGATGNVALASLPSGMGFIFTAMRVTRHDGKTVIHGKGIVPDVVVMPTLDGVRNGRDEALERAAQLAQSAS